MNATARSDRYGPPTPSIAASTLEHDRMARNRQGTTPTVTLGPDEDPLSRAGFRLAGLVQAADAARLQYDRAKVAKQLSRSSVERKRQGRAVTRAKQALDVAEAAVETEKRAEQAAPQVQREMIMHNGVILREPRIEVSASKRVELQPALERLHRRGLISDRQFVAAKRYRSAWELAGRDAFAIGLGGGDGGRSAPQSGNRRVEQAVGNSDDLVRARKAIGIFGTAMLEHIAIEGLALDAWAEKQSMSAHVAKGILIMLLERLAEHWEPATKPVTTENE